MREEDFCYGTLSAASLILPQSILMATLLVLKEATPKIGDRFLETYRAKNIRVLIQIELLPARCHYADEQCTYRNMRARIRVERVEKPTQIYDAVGYSGS